MFLGVDKFESKEHVKITGKRCLVFNYTGTFFTIYVYKKETDDEFERIRKIAFSYSPWVEKKKIDKIWICESVAKPKVIGNQGESKMNDMNIQTIADLQRYV